MNNINDYKDIYNKDGIKIIKHADIDINELIKSLDEWHDDIARIILKPNNIYYYATDNYDSEFYLNELPNTAFSYIKRVLELLIQNPEGFYDEYENNSAFANRINNSSTIEEIQEIIKDAGISIKIDSANLDKVKKQVHRKMCTDYCYGVFGELLFYSVVENVLDKVLLASKVQFITAPGTNAHGSDGIFCDEINKKLYFGEAKFTVSLQSGIYQAINSMNDCLNRIKLDQSFILTHQKSLKNGYGKKIDESNISEYSSKVIIFLLHGKEIDNDNIVETINKNKLKFSEKLNLVEFVIISFPIFDKENLKKEIAKEVSNYDSKYTATE